MKIELKIRKDVLYIKIDNNPWIAKYIGYELERNELSWSEHAHKIGFKVDED